MTTYNNMQQKTNEGVVAVPTTSKNGNSDVASPSMPTVKLDNVLKSNQQQQQISSASPLLQNKFVLDQGVRDYNCKDILQNITSKDGNIFVGNVDGGTRVKSDYTLDQIKSNPSGYIVSYNKDANCWVVTCKETPVAVKPQPETPKDKPKEDKETPKDKPKEDKEICDEPEKEKPTTPVVPIVPDVITQQTVETVTNRWAKISGIETRLTEISGDLGTVDVKPRVASVGGIDIISRRTYNFNVGGVTGTKAKDRD